MTNKKFMKSLCSIIALLFFFATISPSLIQAQVNINKGNSNSLSLFKLAMAAKNGNLALSVEQLFAVKEKSLILMENLFIKAGQSGLSKEALQNYCSILPQDITEKILLVSDIAKSDMTTEGKVNALVSAFDYNCNDIIYVGIGVFVLGYMGIASFGDIGTLIIMAAVLCYIGIF